MNNNPSSESPVTQECSMCGKSFNALMETCPHCGAAGSSLMAGGLDLLAVMASKQKAVKLNDEGAKLFQQGDSGGAMRLLHQSIEENPLHEKAYENLAYVLIQIGRLEEARDTLAKVLTFSPRREAARRYQAEVLSRLQSAPAGAVASAPGAPATPRPSATVAHTPAGGESKPSRKWYQFWK